MAAADATNEIERISGGEVAVSINPTIPSGDHSVWADVSPLFELACRGLFPALSLRLSICFGLTLLH